MRERLSENRGDVDRPRRSREPITLDLDGELVLVDPRTNGLHQLDGIASVIWSILDGEGTVRELADDLADAYQADPEVVREDLDALLERLERVGLLDGTAPPDYLLVGAAGSDDPADGLWRPTYLTDPPAP